MLPRNSYFRGSILSLLLPITDINSSRTSDPGSHLITHVRLVPSFFIATKTSQVISSPRRPASHLTALTDATRCALSRLILFIVAKEEVEISPRPRRGLTRVRLISVPCEGKTTGNPIRTAVPFRGQTTWHLTGLSPKRDCDSKMDMTSTLSPKRDCSPKRVNRASDRKYQV